MGSAAVAMMIRTRSRILELLGISLDARVYTVSPPPPAGEEDTRIRELTDQIKEAENLQQVLENQIENQNSEYRNELRKRTVANENLKSCLDRLLALHASVDDGEINTRDQLTKAIEAVFATCQGDNLTQISKFVSLIETEFEKKETKADEASCDELIGTFFSEELKQHEEKESALERVQRILREAPCDSTYDDENKSEQVEKVVFHFKLKYYVTRANEPSFKAEFENDEYENEFSEMVRVVGRCKETDLRRAEEHDKELFDELCEILKEKQEEAFDSYLQSLQSTGFSTPDFRQKMNKFYETDELVFSDNGAKRDEINEFIVTEGRKTRLVCRLRDDVYVNMEPDKKNAFEHEKSETDSKAITRDWRGMKVARNNEGKIINLVMVKDNYPVANLGKQTKHSLSLYPVNTKDDASVAFERVLLEENQEQVYETVKPFVLSALGGKNVGLFMYGGSGSGKTYTSVGNVNTLNEEKDDEWGIIPRMLRDMNSRENLTFSCQCFEVYGREATFHVYDLLHNMRTFTQGETGRYVPTEDSFYYKFKDQNVLKPYKPKQIKGLVDWYNTAADNQILRGKKFEPVTMNIAKGRDDKLYADTNGDGSPENTGTYLPELIALLMGPRFRKTRGTVQNPGSSRSHFVFKLFLRNQWSEEENEIVIGDLAGVEHVDPGKSNEGAKKQGSNARISPEEIQAMEAKAIVDSNGGFIHAFKKRMMTQGNPKQGKRGPYPDSIYSNPLGVLTKNQLFENTDAKIMFLTCIYPQLISNGEEWSEENTHRLRNTNKVMYSIFDKKNK